ncbi:hypothetical protein THRCLA_07659 [Thraustotheca clavata]|uniref:Uncharacterized protein n=1 Tax=Thraustotheca clavata TaxID=74557 RepID=A0A1V9ZCH0_9STRA|nr:hypothetical protein THRCLA_07659 [Thraustotheca clavata]
MKLTMGCLIQWYAKYLSNGYRRCSLNNTKEIDQFNRGIIKFTNSGFNLWRSENILNYIPPTIDNQMQFTRVQQQTKVMNKQYNRGGKNLFLILCNASSVQPNISGSLSGTLSYQISGPDSQILSASSGFLDAILHGGVLFNTFLLWQISLSDSGTRYVDNDRLIRSETQGNITPYYPKARQIMTLSNVEYPEMGNMTMWNYLFKAIIAEIYNQPVATSSALEELCLVGDGCFSACINASASGGTTLTHMRGGLEKGTSNVLKTYLTSNGTRQQVMVNNTAGPMAIWACFIGGRAPVINYPAHLVDIISQGPQTTLNQW